MIVEEQVLIETSPESVFAFIANTANAHRWQATSTKNKLEDLDHIGLGARIVHLGKVMGIAYRSEAVVTAYEPPTALRYEGTAWGMPMAMDYRIEPVTEGAELTLRSESTSNGIFRLFEPLLRRWTQNLFRGDLARLKRVVESEAG